VLAFVMIPDSGWLTSWAIDAVSAPRLMALVTRASSDRSFKQIDAGVLNIGYAELGPTDGGAVILLHGWPYNIHSYVNVAPLLASAGCFAGRKDSRWMEVTENKESG